MIKLKELGIDFKIPNEPDWWGSVKIDDQIYDIHYCEDYNTIDVYYYDPELDQPIHRYLLHSSQKIK